MKNTIIRASAGSGKTFQLSNRYLDIIFQRESVDTVLASTFTRKAAGEIMSRILIRLADASLDEAKRRELAQFIAFPQPIQLVSSTSTPASREPESEEQALLAILADLARNLYRLRISTLDSFFNKLATTFSLELGLPPGWSILDETDYDRLVGEAVRNVLSASHHSEARHLMNLLQKGEQERSVTRELFDLAKDLLPFVRESSAEAWNHEHLLRPELDEAAIQSIIAQLENADVPVTKKGEPDGRFVKARAGLAQKAGESEWPKFLESTLVQSILAGECLYYKIPVEGDLLNCVQELVGQAHAKIINKLVAQTKATRTLLELVADAYDALLRRERRFRFEDITRRLGDREFSSSLDVLNHRMDAQTAHLLLDEFQDTSMPQWHVMAAFARDVARNPLGSFFCVGDVKQAIYAWRGGESGIFDTIESSIPGIETKSLDMSFRSSPVVLHAVNRLFGTITDNAALSEKHFEAAEAWAAGFTPHKEADRNHDLPGHVVLEVAPDLPEGLDGESHFGDQEGDDNLPPSDKQALLLRYTVDRIGVLYQARPGQSMGVLVARNKMIGPIIAGLKSNGIEASEEGGNPLTDSAAVQHVLSAMVLADHPGNTIARFHLSQGPLADKYGLCDYDDEIQALKASQKIRRELIRDGYGVVVKQMAKELAPACNPREFQRLEKLQELAYRFEETARGARTRRFVDVVRATKVESTSAASIRVMTIHKSKGLEFDIVVLPDLEQKLSRGNPTLVTDRKSPTAPIHRAIRYVGENMQSLLPDDYRKSFQKRITGEVEESFSLLYVAMTRAIHELVMIVPPLSKKGKLDAEKGKPTFHAHFAGVLRAGLTMPGVSHDSDILYEDFGQSKGSYQGFQQYCSKKKQEALRIENASEPELIEIGLAPKPKAARRNLLRETPSGMKSGGYFSTKLSEDVSAFPAQMNADDAKLWGIATHACFEHGLAQNPWLDKHLPSDSHLEEVVRQAIRGKQGKINPAAVVASFLELCQKATVRRTLSQSFYSLQTEQTIKVEHERRFAVRLGDQGKLLRGFIDRLVMIEASGKVVSMDIIDYKTDRVGGGRSTKDLAEERGYFDQLAAYRRGMSQLFGIEEQRITARLLFVECDEVVELEHSTIPSGNTTLSL